MNGKGRRRGQEGGKVGGQLEQRRRLTKAGPEQQFVGIFVFWGFYVPRPPLRLCLGPRWGAGVTVPVSAHPTSKLWLCYCGHEP